MPRKRSEDFYRLHGFTANYERGKYTATCNVCDRQLQNTALSRLSLHRQVCDQRRSQSTAAVPFYTTKMEKDIDGRHHIKIQEVSGEYDDSNTVGKEIIVKIQEIIDSGDDGNVDKTPVLVRSETRKSANEGQELEHHIEYEISDFVDYSNEQQLEESTNESAELMESRPKNNLLALKARKMRAEIKQYQSKTKFFRTETENLKVERTLTLLRIQKLRLEIDALRA
ncbi:uncharacterized protein LOC110186548 [Drosophila serrata]|uniref:uncharacterized protein LOC110186548 n=1 Tax=Drosophila serrata TaxID=7274 RepID=UPI000A1D1702|nr:uncharacterized protein LOC110186548 [Drosophila serrata]